MLNEGSQSRPFEPFLGMVNTVKCNTFSKVLVQPAARNLNPSGAKRPGESIPFFRKIRYVFYTHCHPIQA